MRGEGAVIVSPLHRQITRSGSVDVAVGCWVKRMKMMTKTTEGVVVRHYLAAGAAVGDCAAYPCHR